MPYENAHAVRIDDKSIVQDVVVIPFQGDTDVDVTAYCNSIGLDGKWLDTSYVGSRRKRYAGVLYYFDSERDEFVPPGWELVDGEWQDPNPPAPEEPEPTV